MAPPKEASKADTRPKAEKIDDDRFKAIGKDPRFRRFPKKTSKVQVDDRFAVMFKDDAFQAGSALDKRGRQVKSQNRRKDLASLYQVETPEDEAARAAELAEADERWARMRGIGLAEDSSSSSEEEEEEEAVDEPGSPASSASPTEDEEDRRAREVFGVGALAANPREQVALVPDATRRLAAVDLDWTHVTAVDILAVLRSFLPASGRIERVTVYPSDYGLQRMAEEASAGPRGLWGAEGQADEEGADSDTERRRRRAYELSRLRYYYAVIECDNAATASKIYDECDGMEFLKSACKFDLRFVPDEQSFEARQVRESAEDVPAGYTPPIFQTMALQSTDPEVTWDAPDKGRRHYLSKKLTEDDIKEDDFKAYLASGTEDSEGSSGSEDAGDAEDAEAVKARYRALLLGGGQEEAGAVAGAKKDGATSDKAMELQVTFQPGLESLGEKLAAKVRGRKKGEAETVWDAYVRRRSEKKAEQRRKGRKDVDSSEDEESEDAGSPLSPLEGEEDPFFQREEDPFNDPFFNDGAPQAAEGASDEEGHGAAKTGGRAEKRAGKKGKEAETGASGPLSAAQKAELEMLLMDDPGRSALPVSAEAAPAAKKKLTKKERIRQKKEAKRREREEGSDAEAEPDVPAGKSLEDPRFAALMTSSAFALDPTDPRFDKRSAALAQKLSSRRAKGAPAAQTTAAAPESTPEPTPSAGSALEAMVKSLKRKSKAGAGSASKAKRL